MDCEEKLSRDIGNQTSSGDNMGCEGNFSEESDNWVVREDIEGRLISIEDERSQNEIVTLILDLSTLLNSTGSASLDPNPNVDPTVIKESLSLQSLTGVPLM